MSLIKVNQVRQRIFEMFEPHLDLSDVPAHDSDRESKILSRCLAALAVHVRSGCDERAAAQCIWDGADDNGIDAAYYDSGDNRVILVQSKWIKKGSGEPEAADIGTFTKGVGDVVEHNCDDFHIRLHARLAEISSRLGTPGVSVHVIVVSTGASKLASHAMSRLNKLLVNLNGGDCQDDPIATYEVMGLSEVYASLVDDPLNGNLGLDATIFDWSYVASPYKAYFGMIDGLQLKNWWVKHGKRMVAKNIRHSLGNTDVNLQIRQTSLDSPDLFWYFNNGITMIADRTDRAPAGAAARSAGNFTFKGASIVNGAQTISTLGRISEDEKLGMVRVPFRVILLSGAPENLGQKITRANNLQNRIESRDFVAQDQEQTRLRHEMAIEKIDYQFVRGDDASLGINSCELLELTAALACASGDSSLAVQVKTGIGRFFVDLKRAPYKTLFNPSVSGAKAFNCVLVLRAINKWIDDKKLNMVKKSGTEWGVLVHGNMILTAAIFAKIPSSKLDCSIADFRKELALLDIDSISGLALEKMVNKIKKEYANNFLAVLFKNPTMSRSVYGSGVA